MKFSRPFLVSLWFFLGSHFLLSQGFYPRLNSSFNTLAPLAQASLSESPETDSSWLYRYLGFSIEEIEQITAEILPLPPAERILRLTEQAEKKGTDPESLRIFMAMHLLEKVADGSRDYSEEEWATLLESAEALSLAPSENKLDIPEQALFYWAYYRVKGEVLLELARQGIFLEQHLPKRQDWAVLMAKSLIQGLFLLPENTRQSKETLMIWAMVYSRSQNKEEIIAFEFLAAAYLNQEIMSKDEQARKEPLLARAAVESFGRWYSQIQQKLEREKLNLDFLLQEAVYYLNGTYLQLGKEQEAAQLFKSIPVPEKRNSPERIQYLVSVMDLYGVIGQAHGIPQISGCVEELQQYRQEFDELEQRRIARGKEIGDIKEYHQTQVERIKNFRSFSLACKGLMLYDLSGQRYSEIILRLVPLSARVESMIAEGAEETFIDPEIFSLVMNACLSLSQENQLTVVQEQLRYLFVNFITTIDRQGFLEEQLITNIPRFLRVREGTQSSQQDVEELFYTCFPIFQKATLKKTTRKAIYELFLRLDRPLAQRYIQGVKDELREALECQPIELDKAIPLVKLLMDLDDYEWAMVLLAGIQEWLDYQEWLQKGKLQGDLRRLEGEFDQWRSSYEKDWSDLQRRISFLTAVEESFGARVSAEEAGQTKKELFLQRQGILKEWARLEAKATRYPQWDEWSEFGTILYFENRVYLLYCVQSFETGEFDFFIEQAFQLARQLLGANGSSGRLAEIEKTIKRKNYSHKEKVVREQRHLLQRKVVEEALAFLYFAKAIHLPEARKVDSPEERRVDPEEIQKNIKEGLFHLDKAIDLLKHITDPGTSMKEWHRIGRNLDLLLQYIVTHNNGFAFLVGELHRRSTTPPDNALSLYDEMLKRIRQLHEIGRSKITQAAIDNPEKNFYLLCNLYNVSIRFLVVFSNMTRVGVMANWNHFLDELEQTRQFLQGQIEERKITLPEELSVALQRDTATFLVPYFNSERIWEWEGLLERVNPPILMSTLIDFIRIFNFLEVKTKTPQERERISKERKKVAERILNQGDAPDQDGQVNPQQEDAVLNQKTKLIAMMVLKQWGLIDPMMRGEMEIEDQFFQLVSRSRLGVDVSGELNEVLSRVSSYPLDVVDEETRFYIFDFLLRHLLTYRNNPNRKEGLYLRILAGFHLMLKENFLFGFVPERKLAETVVQLANGMAGQKNGLTDDEEFYLVEMIKQLQSSRDFLILRNLQKLSENPDLQEQRLRQFKEDPKLEKPGWERGYLILQQVLVQIGKNCDQSLEETREKARKAHRRMAFAQEIILWKQVIEESIAPRQEDQQNLTLAEALLESWKFYQLGEDESATETIAALQSADPTATKLRERIQRVREASERLADGRLDRAKGAANYLRNDAIEDPRYSDLLRQIDQKQEEYQRLWDQVRELQAMHQQNETGSVETAPLKEILRKLEEILKIQRTDLQAIQLQLEVAREYYDVGIRLSHRNRHLEAVEAQKKVISMTNEVIQQNREVKEATQTSKKKPNNYQQRPNSVAQQQELSLEDRAKQLQRSAKARIVLENMRIHRRVLDALVRAEERREERLKESFGTIRWRFQEIQVVENGFWIRRFKSLRAVAKVFQSGESYRVYDEKGNLATTAYFRVTEVDSQKHQVRFELIYEEDAKIALASLPEQGGLQRVPNTPAQLQRACLDQLMAPLVEGFRNGGMGLSFPSVGNGLLDRLVGLEVSEVSRGNQLPLTLIQGPSGTGKTQVILAIALKYLGLNTDDYGVRLDESQQRAVASAFQALPGVTPGRVKILIVSQSNAGVDNVGIRLQERGIPFIRVGNNEAAVHEQLRDNWNHREELLNKAKQEYESGKGVIVLGTNNGIQTERHIATDPFYSQFHAVIIEEAGRATLPETLIAAGKASRKLILVGDHQQLPPYAIDDSMIRLIHQELPSEWNSLQNLFDPEMIRLLKVSPFEKLFEEGGVQGIDKFTLLINRRMTPLLARFVSEMIYQGIIQPDPEKVAKLDPKTEKRSLWLVDHGYPERESSVKEDESQDGGRSRYNPGEAGLVVDKVMRLVTPTADKGALYQPEQIMILTPYKAQIAMIKELLTQKELDGQLTPEAAITLRNSVVTVDEIQGSENDVVILSLVRSNPRREIGFLTDLHRLCVSISRQRKELHIFGNFSETFTQAEYKANEAEPDPRKRKRQKAREEEVNAARQVYRNIHRFVKENGMLVSPKNRRPPAEKIHYPRKPLPERPPLELTSAL